MGRAPQLVLNASSLSTLEMDQVSANLSKQDPGHPAKSRRGKVTRRWPAMGMTVAIPSTPGSARWRDGSLPANRAVQGVDQHLDLDELVAGPFGLVAVERRGQHLGMRVPVLDHARTGFIQRFKSLAHFWISFNRGIGATLPARIPAYTDSGHQRHAINGAVSTGHTKKPALLRAFCLISLLYQPR
jgi:hypothetical protein